VIYFIDVWMATCRADEQTRSRIRPTQIVRIAGTRFTRNRAKGESAGEAKISSPHFQVSNSIHQEQGYFSKAIRANIGAGRIENWGI